MRAEIEKAFSPLESSPLRRTTLKAAEIAAKIELEVPVSPEAQRSAEPVEAPPPPRRPSAGPDTPVAPRADISFQPKQPERRKSDRRGMDALRDEALRTLISKVEDKNFGGLRNRVHSSHGINRTRVVLILVAVIAGGLAAYLATREYAPVAAPVAAPAVVTTEVVPEARTKILVAKAPIAVGERLSAALVEWEDWPASTVRSEYITSDAAPDAMADMEHSAARVQFFPGEPIRAEKLAQAGQGFLAAVLDAGMRAVSVSVGAESASGGFIVPDDHVDVVLTRPSTAGQISNTILHNVRVLAINGGTGDTSDQPASDANADAPRPEVFTNIAIATLELDPNQAEVIINATSTGKLSLVLRPTLDLAETGSSEQRATNQAIRISSPFWAN